MNPIIEIKAQLNQAKKLSNASRFFKTGPGDYAEHDQFMGVSMPDLRAIAKDHAALERDMIQVLLESPWNDERCLALILLVNQYKKADDESRKIIYEFYLKNIS